MTFAQLEHVDGLTASIPPMVIAGKPVIFVGYNGRTESRSRQRALPLAAREGTHTHMGSRPH